MARCSSDRVVTVVGCVGQDPRLPAAAREKVELKRIQSFASLHPPELFKDLEQHKLDALRELKSVLKEELAATERRLLIRTGGCSAVWLSANPSEHAPKPHVASAFDPWAQGMGM